MNRKKQKICRVVAVVFGVSCYFYAQADLKMPTKVPLKVLAPSTGPTEVKKTTALSGNKESGKQAKNHKKLEELKKSLQGPGQSVGLTILLAHVTEQAESCSTVNPDTVKQMFSRGTELAFIEQEAGGKFFDNREQFMDAGAKQANEQRKSRVADILNIRKWHLKENETKSCIDALLVKQRHERLLFFYCTLVDAVKQIVNCNETSDELGARREEAEKKILPVLQTMIKEQDKKFNLDALGRDLLDIARDDKSNSAIIVDSIQERLACCLKLKKSKWWW